VGRDVPADRWTEGRAGLTLAVDGQGRRGRALLFWRLLTSRMNRVGSSMNPLSSENCDRFQPLFSRHRLTMGRQLPVSAEYRRYHPRSIIWRHADVFAVRAGYVWHGDIDIRMDAAVLREIARELNDPFYVLREAVRRSLNTPMSVEQLTRLSDWNTRDGQSR